MVSTFCLLAVSGTQVRYFDGLSDEKESCRTAAEQLCKSMNVEMPENKHNVSLQYGAECAMFILHCAEAELHELHGQHRAVVGWPDSVHMKSLRERVSGWCKGLEGERLKWASQWAIELDARSKRMEKWNEAWSRSVFRYSG